MIATFGFSKFPTRQTKHCKLTKLLSIIPAATIQNTILSHKTLIHTTMSIHRFCPCRIEIFFSLHRMIKTFIHIGIHGVNFAIGHASLIHAMLNTISKLACEFTKVCSQIPFRILVDLKHSIYCGCCYILHLKLHISHSHKISINHVIHAPGNTTGHFLEGVIHHCRINESKIIHMSDGTATHMTNKVACSTFIKTNII